MSEPNPLDGSAGPTPHLSWLELTTHRTGPAQACLRLEHLQHHSDLWPPMRRVAAVVEALRSALKGRPIRVTCGLRLGDRTSQHDHGQALDVQIDGLTPLYVSGVLHGLQVAGGLPHPLRQVLAETTHGVDGLAEPMQSGGGGWVHVAVLGVAGERYTDPASLPVGRSWVTGGRRVYVA